MGAKPATNRRQFLAMAGFGTAASIFGLGRSIPAGSPRAHAANIEPDRPSLKELAERRGLKFGMAVRHAYLANSEVANLIRKQSAIVVPEGSMKAENMQPRKGEFYYDKADAIAEFARDHGIALRGHAFVWHRAMPKWMMQDVHGNWEETLYSHIAGIAPRYKVSSWDVCVEVVGAEGGELRHSSPWYQAAGDAYILRAYQIARELCLPGTKLSYCDFGCEQNQRNQIEKRKSVLKLLEKLAAEGVVDTFSSQAHLFLSKKDTFSAAAWRTFLKDVRSIGLKVSITELDVQNTSPREPGQIDREASDLVKGVIGTWLEETQGGEELLVWGPRDDLSFLQEEDRANLQRPLPWDEHGNPKSMEIALRELM